MIKYSIKDLEKLTGIKAHTIRMWEKRYQFLTPDRTMTNIRSYSDKDLRTCINISILNRNGYKISRIVKMPLSEISDKILEITENVYDFDIQIETLIVAMSELDESKFDKILTTSILKLGLENTVTQIIYPFFEKIGVLWQLGTINPGQEHFVSSLIRQKLIIAIDGQLVNPHSDAKLFLLFLPSGEYHEIGLLYGHYLIKKAGFKVIYLSQNVPFEDLKEVGQIKTPNFLFTSFTSNIAEKELQDYIDQLSNVFPKQIIFVSGFQVREHNIKFPANVKQISSSDELHLALQTL
jgi:MerR family transcriptional regulator, light-induced transcriptional regulator